MAQEKQQRLDVQFPFDDEAKVQPSLRLLTRILEARLAVLEAQRADYESAVNALTTVALTRIDEVLRPSLDILDELISLGFPSERISDAGALGRLILGAADSAAFYATTGAASQVALTAGLAAAAADTAALAQKVTTVLAGADPLLDTFAEIAAALQDDDNALAAIVGRLNGIDTALTNRLRFDAAQSIGAPAQGQALSNLGFSAFTQNARGLADQAAWRAHINAQQGLGFPPVEQGGGEYMGSNKLRFGWDAGLSAIRAQVDAVGLGTIWADNQGSLSRAANGYQKLPSGLLIQWVSASIISDARVNFPTSFPSLCIAIWGQPYWGLGDNEAWAVSVSADDVAGFTANVRHITPGAVTREAYGVGCKFLAFGW